MGEQIIFANNPLTDAVGWLTDNGNRQWQFTSWSLVSVSGYQDKKNGMRGTIAPWNITFYVHHDWDVNKGYHVNAKRTAPNGTITRAYTSNHFDDKGNCLTPEGVLKNTQKTQASQCYATLTEMISNHGDQEAAKWFMSIA